MNPILEDNRPKLKVSVTELHWPGLPANQARSKVISVVNRGGGILDWKVRSAPWWLKTRREGNQLIVRVRNCGRFHGAIRLASNGGNTRLRVTSDVWPDRRTALVGAARALAGPIILALLLLLLLVPFTIATYARMIDPLPLLAFIPVALVALWAMFIGPPSFVFRSALAAISLPALIVLWWMMNDWLNVWNMLNRQMGAGDWLWFPVASFSLLMMLGASLWGHLIGGRWLSGFAALVTGVSLPIFLTGTFLVSMDSPVARTLGVLIAPMLIASHPLVLLAARLAPVPERPEPDVALPPLPNANHKSWPKFLSLTEAGAMLVLAVLLGSSWLSFKSPPSQGIVRHPDRRVGHTAWVYTAGGPITSSPAINNYIVFGSADGRITGLDHFTGQRVWSFRSRGAVITAPAVTQEGWIYFGTSERLLYSIEWKGKLRWKLPLSGLPGSCPAIAEDGTIYVGCDDGKLHAVFPDGKIRWTFVADGAIKAAPVIGHDGTIYFGAESRTFHALTPAGASKWVFKTGAPILSSAAIDDEGVLYFNSMDDRLFALNPDGTQKWFRALEEAGQGIPTDVKTAMGSPVLGLENVIYCPTTQNRLHAVTASGNLMWSFDRVSMHSTAAISSDGTIYIGGVADTLWALSPEGRIVIEERGWGQDQPSLAEPFQTPIVASDGTIYCTQGNRFHAIGFKGWPALNGPWPMYQANVHHVGRARPVSALLHPSRSASEGR